MALISAVHIPLLFVYECYVVSEYLVCVCVCCLQPSRRPSLHHSFSMDCLSAAPVSGVPPSFGSQLSLCFREPPVPLHLHLPHQPLLPMLLPSSRLRRSPSLPPRPLLTPHLTQRRPYAAHPPHPSPQARVTRDQESANTRPNSISPSIP